MTANTDMDMFACSFAEDNLLAIVALSPESAATIYATENFNNLIKDNKDKILSKDKKIIYLVVSVWNKTKNEYCGWFKVEFANVVIAECSRCPTPEWVKKTNSKFDKTKKDNYGDIDDD